MISDIIKTVKNPSKELVASLVAILVIFGYVQGVVVPSVANQSAAVSASKSYNALAPGSGPCVPSTTVKCGTVRIIKNTLPDNYQDFNFTTNITGYPPTFTLDDDATLVNPSALSNVQYFNVFNGNYNVAETPSVPGFTVTVSCTDPSGGTLTGGTSASISVSNLENITCTFRNVGAPQTHVCVPTPTVPCGSITIIKDTVPDDYQDFAFSNTVPGYPTSFTLDDDATLTNPSATPNIATFTTPMTGSYTIAETTSLVGYAVTIACTDPSGGTTTSGVTANISISNAENVVCTFTNTSNTIGACTPNTWTQKANFGGGIRDEAVAFSIGNKGFIGTGSYWQTMFNDFWEYDPVTNIWTQKANFGGVAREAASGFSIGNKGYIGVGQDSNGVLQDFWEYDPATNLWTQKANFGGVARSFSQGISIGTKGYIGMGEDINSTSLQDFWEYDPLTNSWTQKANYGGGPMASTSGFSIGNKGYVGTGIANGASQSFWEYNPSTNVWVQKANFGGGSRFKAASFSVGTKGYLGTGSFGQLQDFWEYDPITNVWTQKANFGGGARSSTVGFSIGNKGYVGTGIGPGGAPNDVRQDLWEYCP